MSEEQQVEAEALRQSAFRLQRSQRAIDLAAPSGPINLANTDLAEQLGIAVKGLSHAADELERLRAENAMLDHSADVSRQALEAVAAALGVPFDWGDISGLIAAASALRARIAELEREARDRERNAVFAFAYARVGTGSQATDADILNWLDGEYPIDGEYSPVALPTPEGDTDA